MKWPQAPGPGMAAAMLCAALIGAQYIAGKAARDALFLAAFDPALLPRMIIGTSIFSILLVIASSRLLNRVAPAAWVPLAFAASALLFLIEWGITGAGPGVAASLLYLQVSGFGPLLGSGFWLLASERFDPRTAKKNVGTIAGAGTLGGLLGGLLAARVTALTGIETLLPLLGAANAICAWQVWSMSRRGATTDSRPQRQREPENGAPGAGLRILTGVPYLRNLALLVLLGTISAVMIDYVFKVQVKDYFGRGPQLGSFFSIYYAVISLITFAVQTLASKTALERFGLAACASTPALSLAGGGVLAMAVPGLPSLVLTRGTEAVSRGSLYRSGYELFYAPMAPRDKRAVKSVIDVGVDRSGDIIGALLVQGLLLLPAVRQTGVMIVIAVACSIAATLVARRLTAGYVRTLEQNLLNRAVELDLSEAADQATRTVMLRTLQLSQGDRTTSAGPGSEPSGAESDIERIKLLQTRDATRVARSLRRERDLPAALVPHVIPLLEWDDVALDAMRALRSVAEPNVGALTDAMIDPSKPFAVRRRLARVFSVCVSQRAIDSVLLGLDDLRFEVRYQSARSAGTMLSRNPSLVINPDRILAIVRREVSVSRTVWEGRQLLDTLTAPDDHVHPLDAAIGARATQSMTHVFALLSLALPAEPLRVAYQGLFAGDQGYRGTALEYLDAVLPPDIRNSLWPFLEGGSVHPRQSPRSREDIAADLLAAHQSIQIDLTKVAAGSRAVKS